MPPLSQTPPTAVPQVPPTPPFTPAARAKSFWHAGRGAWRFFRMTHNAWLHATLLAVAVLLGIALRITHADWLALVLAGGLVFTAEAFNTAMEVHMNLTSPGYHDLARDTKDIAAAAVLIAAITAFIVGISVFGSRLAALFLA